MSRFSSFLFGMLLGAGLVYVGLKYHLVRAEGQIYWIPKLTANFQDAYVDVREFTPADWAEHPELFLAVSQAGKSEVLTETTAGAAENLLNETLDRLRPFAEQPR